MDKNIKVLVICGGFSTEREISLQGGKAIYNALLELGYKNTKFFDLTDNNLMEILQYKPDIAYIALHGKGGEDGNIQGLLELANIHYTGPGVASSAICMDKILTKKMLEFHNIPTAKFNVYHKEQCANMSLLKENLIKEFGLPLVMKSPCQGSSIGVEIVRKIDDLENAINNVFKYGDDMLVEEFLTGTELTLPILGNKELTVLPEIEITSEREFYDFTAKYTSGLCHHIIPARITESEREKVKEIGKDTYKCLNCKGLSRIDFIIDKNKGPMVIEVNTIPGMTQMSLFPDSAKSAGIDFNHLVEKILLLGMERI